MVDLDEAIRVTREAVNATQGEPLYHAMYLQHLGSRLFSRYSKTGSDADLEESIKVGQRALDLIPKDFQSRAIYLDDLGTSFGDRYLRTGAISDLEESIRLRRQAVEITPNRHLNRPTYLSHLSVCLGDRYTRTRAIVDLEEAIRVGQQAVEAASQFDHHDHEPECLNNLGARFTDRYARTGVLADLEEAIRLGQQAVDKTPENSPAQAKRLNNLAVAFSNRYLKTGLVADIEEAIRLGQAAINANPQGHPDQARDLNNLGVRLGDKYYKTKAMADLEEAIRAAKAAVEATPRNHPIRALYSQNLGIRLGDRYSSTGATVDLEKAISYHQTALHQHISPTAIRIQAGRHILRLCGFISDWPRAYEASNAALDLVPKLTPRSFENSDRQFVLAQISGFASDAAAIALSSGKEPLLALKFLEQGRGLLATSIEEMRADILDLQESDPELAEKFIACRDALDLPIARNTTTRRMEGVAWDVQASRRNEAASTFDQLISDIRERPGFEDFLLPPNEEEMRGAASRGPIAVINTSNYRCDAILIETHQIRSLSLPLTSSETEDMARQDSLGSPEVLEWLWEAVACPILDALGFCEDPVDNDWPHLWWIPTGSLSRFPLHAAGRHGQRSSETVVDRVMSSYSPSVKAIIHGRRRDSHVTSSGQNRALLVAMEHTPGQSSLPFAKKEVAVLRDLCSSMPFDPVEPGRRKQDIVSHLADCQIFHFAGHGYTDEEDPSRSRLFLEDGASNPLTVATLLEMNLYRSSPFLAYLSACGTGRIKDERFVDESIHLISACQLAGFRHVIGTLWEVDDELCVQMAKLTYEGIKIGGITDDSVCRGLHSATRELRDRWLDTPAKARVGRSARKTAAPLTVDDIAAESANDGDKKSRILPRDPRDVVLDEEERPVPLWVPYVHFGV